MDHYVSRRALAVICLVTMAALYFGDGKLIY
jgi:hypothetical protein